MRKILLIAFLFCLLLFSSSDSRAQTEVYIRLTLEDVIDIALEKNRDVLNAREETNKSDYLIIEAVSSALPQINGLWNFDKNLKRQVFVISFPDSDGVMRQTHMKIGTDYNLSLGASLTQSIYVGGKVGAALRAAKIYKNFSNETLKTVQQNVVTGVVQSFYIVLLADELHNIAMESLAQAKNHLGNVQSLFDAGKATEYDLLRARVQVANLKPDAIGAKNNVEISLLSLKDVMGIDAEIPLDIEGSLSEPDTSYFAYATSTVAFQNRSDLKATKFNAELYKENVTIARGDFLPTLSATTTFSYNGYFDKFKYDRDDWNQYWFAGFSLSFPIFNGLRNYSKYNQAKIDYRKAQTDYRKLRNTTVIEVKRSVMNLRQAVETIDTQRLNIEEAERAVQLSESLYTNGMATQLEVLDAQFALAVAKTNMANALYEGKVAEITLRKNLGIIEVETEEGE